MGALFPLRPFVASVRGWDRVAKFGMCFLQNPRAPNIDLKAVKVGGRLRLRIVERASCGNVIPTGDPSFPRIRAFDWKNLHLLTLNQSACS